ncbi:transcription termination/antitermination protein NusA [Candidatus Uhrbacteria bacterium CG_4_9_14_3_um_filter_36_7]|uniref:Transcription termination/antitermination protein NusA n=1 Tax=Candidatus Uhrbacteria bacterium CG_4_9_14_3_um_filter_36_7 TaxID=1975033 RepID=A0A2M7XH89_9BACT|nr:MAG: transcription termination/antitermination protein NusA [Candidatus Uhrbacteria bacterium CG_4_9_14_3_um_filter_36_7]
MSSPIEQAIRQVCEEKGLSYEAVIATIEAALASAYRKDYGDKEKPQNIEVNFNPATGETHAFDVKTVVEDMDLDELRRLEEERRLKMEALAVDLAQARERGEDVSALSVESEDEPLVRFNPKNEIMLAQAKEIKPDAAVGDVIRTELPEPSGGFGRMAAMTAKQVITQRLREAEREVIFHEFKEKEGQIIQVTVQRHEGGVVFADVGRVTGLLRLEDQIPNERYHPGDRLTVYVRQVSLTSRGPEILLSRTASELLVRIFEMEIPEITDGNIIIKGISREPGARSKVAVYTENENIDPIGACIGQRGTRIQTIIMMIGGEKIDMIEWKQDPSEYIRHALSPAKIQEVIIREDEHVAYVKVNSDQLSLAIGKGGQNVRLAARLTGWKININEGEAVSEQTEAEQTIENKQAESSTNENIE